MSAALPPVPDLIPISALRKGSSASNNNNNNGKVLQECAPCSSTQCSDQVEVMGEQRSRQKGQPAAVELIDTSRSRGRDGAAPQQPASRKARTERHRKSDRRRDRGRERRKRSSSSKPSSVPSSPERPANPRVNPIFVWVRQKDNHIVEVKCEDYDKRNRILLTKTAQGWRAIPRTETLAPALQRSDDKPRKVKKRTNSKVKRKSAAVQVENGDLQDLTAETSEPPEEVPVPEKSPPLSVNSGSVASDCSAQDRNATVDCHNKCDVTPLDNLLAVAELEFNHQIQQEQWEHKTTSENEQESEYKEDDQITNMEQLDMFIESCAPADPPSDDLDETKPNKSDDCECDYTEEEENNIAMDDILSRLEQSLRSPDTLHSEISEIIKQANSERYSTESTTKPEAPKPVKTNKPDPQEVPTDLSKSKEKFTFDNTTVDDMMPTDLSVPKNPSSPKRPPSQNSETIQSPQPSGIPAVPPSPDIYHHNSANKNKNNIYLESLLSPNTKEKEPLDLGKPRESDSPKVTCSQEVQNTPEPPPKKVKLEDLTLKRLLDNETAAKKDVEKHENKNETPRLLELLTHDIDPDPVIQLKQVLTNASLNVPDPMLIPKDRLSLILSSPAKEIPKLLTQRPELRLPEALAYPHLLQDPDILVITLAQLETIVQKQCQSIPITEKEEPTKKTQPPPPPESPKQPNISSSVSPPKQPAESGKTKKSKMSELSSDIDAATNAAFTQMMWLPYLNQLENAAMSFGGGNPDLLKILSTMLPSYGPSEMSHMMGNNRLPFPPPAFPMQPQMNYNPLELSMWQEAMLQANLTQRNKNQFDFFTNKEYANAKSLYQKTQNPYLNMPGQFQPRPNLQIPQYNPHINPKYPTKTKPSPNHNPSSTSKGSNSYQQKLYENEKMLMHQQHRHKQEQLLKQQEYLKQQELYAQKPKVACKPFANMSEVKRPSGPRVSAPIDLSGSTTASGSKLKVKQHLVDHGNTPRLLKHDDIPEVGSTTASIEEMQDAQKHLWHPLFGNQKSYSSPWNWTTVTATGE